jgi:hypothetical protein
VLALVATVYHSGSNVSVCERERECVCARARTLNMIERAEEHLWEVYNVYDMKEF